ncbi:MAG: GTP-binding protein [Burkholderiaceae bacterium]|nr:GTP-binding protein [Burkholderiaceae bacterium]
MDLPPRISSPARLPVDLITGYLGSGKTTLINAVLRDPAFARSMVIVNEFGEVGLDHLLVGQSDDQVLLLESGCLCCAVSGNLHDTLIDLFARRASGRVPAFDRIVVETSGLANPAPLIATLLSHSALAPRCSLSQVLTVVDAGNGAHTLARYAEARRQVALADRLVVTKAECLADRYAVLAGLRELLRRFNPAAPIEIREPERSPLAHFQPAAGVGHDPLALHWRGPLRGQYGSPADDGDAQPAVAEAGIHDAGFARVFTRAWRIPQLLDWPTYAAWTALLRRRLDKRLLRCKGLLAIADPDSRWVVQGVQGHFAPPSRLPMRPPSRPAPSGFVVMIGEDLEEQEVAEAMALLGAGQAPGIPAPASGSPLTDRTYRS